MKEWTLFTISVGTILIITSNLMTNPMFNIIGGIILISFGISRLRKDKKNSGGK